MEHIQWLDCGCGWERGRPRMVKSIIRLIIIPVTKRFSCGYCSISTLFRPMHETDSQHTSCRNWLEINTKVCSSQLLCFLSSWKIRNLFFLSGFLKKETRNSVGMFFNNYCCTFNSVFRYLNQECIPVGCILSSVVAVPGGGVSACQTPPVNRMADTCKTITLLQLRCGR